MRKSQIKMGENIGVLFIFFILIALGMMFYMKLQNAELKSLSQENFEKKSVSIAQKISTLPELQCSKDNIWDEVCFDLYKIEAMNQLISDTENRIYYFDAFGYANITIYIYKLTNDEGVISYPIYDLQKPNFTQKSVYYLPFSIYSPTQDRKDFGYLKVEVYK